jgi:hypothetical protein
MNTTIQVFSRGKNIELRMQQHDDSYTLTKTFYHQTRDGKIHPGDEIVLCQSPDEELVRDAMLRIAVELQLRDFELDWKKVATKLLQELADER